VVPHASYGSVMCVMSLLRLDLQCLQTRRAARTVRRESGRRP
jgi:hypothetical protein